MAITIRRWRESELEAWRSLLRSPGIADQFDLFTDDGALEQLLTDPHCDRSCIHLALDGEEAIGFGFAFVLANAPRGWAMVRLGVHESHRRRGIGRRLAEAVLGALRAHPQAADLHEWSAAAFVPNPGAEALAGTLGLALDRTYWLMERPARGIEAPRWPSGIETRSFDGSDAMLVNWNDVYNASFARHHRYVPSSADDARQIASGPRFEPDGLLLAYRAGRCVGFCRNEHHDARGEVSVLGVDPGSRGIGLGRALLRWGVRWLEARPALRVTLLVDGDNESALTLYRSEGFEVVRTRRLWARPIGEHRAPAGHSVRA